MVVLVLPIGANRQGNCKLQESIFYIIILVGLSECNESSNIGAVRPPFAGRRRAALGRRIIIYAGRRIIIYAGN